MGTASKRVVEFDVDALREIDATISELPGLGGLRLLEGVLDAALERSRALPSPALGPAARGGVPLAVPAKMG